MSREARQQEMAEGYEIAALERAAGEKRAADRLFLAGLAMQGMLHDYTLSLEGYECDSIARNAVRLADRMLQELEGGK